MPPIPNRIQRFDGVWLDISDMTQEQLQVIGTAWTEALMRKARDRVSKT